MTEIPSELQIEPILSPRDFLTPRYQAFFDEAVDWIGKYDTPIQWEDAGVRPIDRRIRIRLWNEMQNVVLDEERVRVNLSKIRNNEISQKGFENIFKTKIRAAYIFTKPLDHNEAAMTLLEESFENLRKIVKMPINDKRGKPISTLITAKLRAHQMLSDRVLGQTVQRIQQHTVTEKKVPLKSVEDLDEEIRKLESGSPSGASLVLEADVEQESLETESQSSQPTSPRRRGRPRRSSGGT